MSKIKMEELIFIIISTLLLSQIGSCELQGPDKLENKDNAEKPPLRNNDRKSSELHEKINTPSLTSESKELNYQTRGMAIQKLSENIEKIEEQRKLKELVTDQHVDEIEASKLYEQAISIFNKTSADKSVGYLILNKAANLGHSLAKAELAWAHLLGHFVELDIEYARSTFEELAQKGIPEAHMGLGFMYSIGIGYNVSQSKALVHYYIAAMGDNTFAQMALGYRFSFGINVPSSCEKALEYYRRVAKKVSDKITFASGPAIHRVRLLDEIENPGGHENDLVEYYQLLADKGDVQAQIALGQLYYQGGRSTPQNHEKAHDYFTQAANAGNAIGYAFLGKMYLEGSEYFKADNDAAFKLFKKAAELGNPIGQSGLGLMYLLGRGVEKDTTKALNYFTQAADQGWVDGQLQLGNMYFTGNGVKVDFKLAIKYFNSASQSGHVLAYYNLGTMHALGLGMMRQCPVAVEFFKNVAERGRWSEKVMNAYQDFKSYHIDESFMQYALLAEMGYEVGQTNAAFLLDRGDVQLFKDRSGDLVRAFNYWKRAASQGYSAAQVKLGDYYYYGLGTFRDYETAASLYRKASDQQYNAQAMFNLGYMHEQGLGMKKDWHLAKRLYDLAAETNADAKIPVALALLKLQVLIKLETVKESPFRFVLHLDENIAANWDLYLITILTLLLGFVIYNRRPPQIQDNIGAQQPPRQNNNDAPQQNNEN
ncbi:protein sel-1 homolog 1 [Condylostylus longicornis]|uniref:protein sel-1 homolog 1 n=1 Tax=Condylostylus longicornis TaxID=2530218 RepID=UPI00244E134B|nr:protein sel-1 homolog 1 [Condylostylus longicornis]